MALQLLGNGRVLNETELLGKRIVYLFTLHYAGTEFRWATEEIDIGSDDGDLHFRAMDGIELDDAFNFDTDSPIELSLSFDNLVFPGTVDLPELEARGHALDAAWGELAVLPHDGTFEDRFIILTGKISDPIFGEKDQHPNAASFTLEQAEYEDRASFPPAWHTMPNTLNPDDAERLVPFVFGAPGHYRYQNDSGGGSVIGYSRRASPGILFLAGLDLYGVAVHGGNLLQERLDVTLLVYNATRDEHAIALMEKYNAPFSDVENSIWFVNLTSYTDFPDSSGGWFASGSSSFSSGTWEIDDEIWVSSWRLNVNPSSGTIIVEDIGAQPRLDWTEVLSGAGDLLLYMLLQSSLDIDFGRCSVAAELLNVYRLHGYIDEFVAPYEWIQDNLLSILPVSIATGPKGLYPIVWRYDATRKDVVASFTEGPGWSRLGGIRRDADSIVHEVTISYVPGPDGFLQSLTVSGAVADFAYDETELPDWYTRPDGFGRAGWLRYNQDQADSPVTLTEEIEADLVFDVETAGLIAGWKLRANAFAKRFIRYRAPVRFAWLEPGSVISVTDSEMHLDDQICLVKTRTWAVTEIVFELLIIEDPAKDTKPTG